MVWFSLIPVASRVVRLPDLSLPEFTAFYPRVMHYKQIRAGRLFGGHICDTFSTTPVTSQQTYFHPLDLHNSLFCRHYEHCDDSSRAF